MTNRSEFQNSVLEIKDFKNLVLRVATGVGKSRIALNLYKKFGIGECVIIIDKNVNEQNWLKEIRLLELDETKFKILNYKSLHKIKEADFIIFDEAGSLFGEVTFSRYSKLKVNRAVFLDATIKDSDISKLKEVSLVELKIQDAINSEFLPTPKIIIKYIDINKVKKDFIFTKSRFKKDLEEIDVDYKDWKKLFFSDQRLKLNIRCNAKQYLSLINEEISYYIKKFYIERFKHIARNLGVARKRILGEIKEEAVRNLIEDLKKQEKRFVVFCSSVEQAYRFSDNVVCSDNKNNRELIDNFNNKITNELYNVSIVVRAENLIDIDCAIIVQLSRGIDNNNEKLAAFEQQLGRVLRGKNPVLYIFIVKDSVDEDFLKENITKELKAYVEKNTEAI